MSTETPAPAIIEARFAAAPLYRDAKGYIWQRLRNGMWRSTDGCTETRSTPRWADQPADERWAPYTRIDVAPPLDFVHALVQPRQEGKAAALAVIEDLRAQLELANGSVDRLSGMVDNLIQQRDQARASADRFRRHSVTLNTIGWKIADALHELPEGVESAQLDPVDALDRLIQRYVAASNRPAGVITYAEANARALDAVTALKESYERNVTRPEASNA